MKGTRCPYYSLDEGASFLARTVGGNLYVLWRRPHSTEFSGSCDTRSQG